MERERYSTSVLSDFILSSFYFILIIDDINGALLGNGLNFPISIIYKLAISLCIIIWLLKYNKGLKIFTAIITYVALVILILSFSFKPEIFKTLNHLFRFIFTILVYSFLLLRNRQCYIYPKLIKILSYNSIVLLVNILLILVGIGFQNYEDNGTFTSKGFFFAGNELSGLFILLCPTFLYFISTKEEFLSLKFWGSFCAITLATILLGSKTAIIGTFFLNLIVLKNFFSKFGKIKVFYSILLFIIVIITIYGYKLVVNWDLWQRWTYFYDKGGLAKVFFSDRDAYWEEEKSEIFNSGITELVFGLGGDRTVEMDFFDAFLNYGIIGVCIIYSFYFIIIRKVYALRAKIELAKIVLFTDLFFLIFSALAGHMIFSGMAAPFVAIINILPLAQIKYQNLKSAYSYDK